VTIPSLHHHRNISHGNVHGFFVELPWIGLSLFTINSASHDRPLLCHRAFYQSSEQSAPLVKSYNVIGLIRRHDQETKRVSGCCGTCCPTWSGQTRCKYSHLCCSGNLRCWRCSSSHARKIITNLDEGDKRPFSLPSMKLRVQCFADYYLYDSLASIHPKLGKSVPLAKLVDDDPACHSFGLTR
jgi:hypothetical protein